MNENRSFRRKIIYLSIMAALLVPLAGLSRPGSGKKDNSGGKLARMRMELGLSEANLGEIDPVSETFKLATLGMRGVACNILWEKAREYQKTEDWSNLSATLTQMIRLQPNMISVWQFQAWNLAYNVSAEWDDYRDRYFWVIKGILFLEEGTRYNENDPDLIREMGRFSALKIGRADESKQFRRIFRKDDDFHGLRPPEKRDNWLVGKEYYHQAEGVIRFRQLPIHLSPRLPGMPYRDGPSELLFWSDAPMCQMHYADALEIDGGPDGRGLYGEAARRAWSEAQREWRAFGKQLMSTSMGVKVRLEEVGVHYDAAEKIGAELDRLYPGVREKVRAEKHDRLSPEEKAFLALPGLKRTTELMLKYSNALYKVSVTDQEVAEAVEGAGRKRALGLGKKSAELRERNRLTDTYRGIVNFDYWEFRCRFESSPDTIRARELIAAGSEAYQDGDSVKAKRRFEEGLAKWKTVIDRKENRPLWDMDDEVVDHLKDSVRKYSTVLTFLDEKIPNGFPLHEFMTRVMSRNKVDPELEKKRKQMEKMAPQPTLR